MKKCHAAEVADLMGKKWTIALMQEITANGNKGFNHIFSRMKKISPKLLAQRLKELEKLNIVEKRIVAEKMPVRTTYRLTRKGREFLSLMVVVQRFGMKYGNSSSNCGRRQCTECEYY